MYAARITCWHCGTSKTVETSAPPQFGFELAGWALQVGMVGYNDPGHRRVLIFCNAAHADLQRTKSGEFRLRPLRVEPA